MLVVFSGQDLLQAKSDWTWVTTTGVPKLPRSKTAFWHSMQSPIMNFRLLLTKSLTRTGENWWGWDLKSFRFIRTREIGDWENDAQKFIDHRCLD